VAPSICHLSWGGAGYRVLPWSDPMIRVVGPWISCCSCWALDPLCCCTRQGPIRLSSACGTVPELRIHIRIRNTISPNPYHGLLDPDPYSDTYLFRSRIQSIVRILIFLKCKFTSSKPSLPFILMPIIKSRFERSKSVAVSENCLLLIFTRGQG